MDFTSRLRAAFLTSIADLFISASSILLILVVLARPVAEVQTPRFVDRELWCQSKEGAGWLLTSARGESAWTFKEWLERETDGALLIRAGIWVGRNEMACYREFEQAAVQHNARLTQRGTVTASIA